MDLGTLVCGSADPKGNYIPTALFNLIITGTDGRLFDMTCLQTSPICSDAQIVHEFQYQYLLNLENYCDDY